MKKLLLLFVVAKLGFISCSKEDNPKIIPEIKNKWISEVLEFNPAPGQYQNKEDLSPIEEAKKIVGETNSFISLGTFGGNVIFKFENDLQNEQGNDLAVFGNSFLNSSEPAIVMVSYDENKNGKADDKWYELKGSEYNKSETTKNFSITYYKPKNSEDTHKIRYTTSTGLDDTLDFNIIKEFHSQEIYPKNAEEKITFKGTLLKNNAISEGGIYKKPAYEWGYADNKGYEQKEDLKGADLFDFDNTINESGEKINIEKVSFVKIYNATMEFSKIPFIGERGAEISKAKYLH